MVNASTGKITQIMGESFCTNQNQEITVNYADDIGAGWTPNGIQFLERNNNGFEVILEFSPDLIINENWGPTAINWKNDSTILIKCVENNAKGGYLTLYKKLQFKKQ